jgi:N-acetylglucosaminyl-diphospho-decaprenol L-rhamnosyltransferase
MNSNVSVIIVTHKHKTFIDACLRSVFDQVGVPFEIIVVDNASGDGCVERVRKYFPKAVLLPQKVRRGFSANVNTGIMKSRGRYILILNPDTQMFKGALKSLMKRLKSDKRTGICGPKLVNPDGSVQLSFRNFPTWKTGLLRRTPLRNIFQQSAINKEHLNANQSHSIAQRVDWMLGACLLIKREMLDDIGLFDERYPLYVEDIDFCMRAHFRGWGVWYEPGAVVMHHHMAESDKGGFTIHSYYHAIGMIQYIKKFWLHSPKNIPQKHC